MALAFSSQARITSWQCRTDSSLPYVVQAWSLPNYLNATQEPMDLQSQQRPYTVEATTKDGICLEFNTFGPFQLDAGEQQPELGKPFPFRKSSVFKAFHAQSIDIKRDELDGEVVEKRVRRRWDELYEMIGTHVMQDIISGYKFDELHEPLIRQKTLEGHRRGIPRANEGGTTKARHQDSRGRHQ